ncbi:unnamed protein product (macronuclear) [Paramecium tetraurelia]|uniref:Transmembrane protein n=1 Tax=Paramecium tetraurelia TaxID=5888 RepID=A0CG29_PARTE|nr:uncharacterized protein GSPATT00038190001 [Paramecium tetraurelia]CAK69746.1 unnamed protein product [Paramecium tetraurelia]|eukprot:XP_001437143.1 hypothetical protein (macronuclear) [Paramecium tetraurelia strain d4-2]
MKGSQQSVLLKELKEIPIYSDNWFWKLRMRNQALLQFSIIFVLMLGVVLGIYLVNMAIIVPLLEQSSFEIYNSNAKHTLQSHLRSYDGILNGIFNINIHQLEILHQIYTQSYRNLEKQDNITLDYRAHMNYAGTNQMPQILVNQPSGSLQKTHSFMCYTNKTNITYPMDKVTLINLKIQETMYPIGHILDATKLNIKSLFYVGTLEEPQVYFSYPCTNFKQAIYGLNIPKRPWFLKGIMITIINLLIPFFVTQLQQYLYRIHQRQNRNLNLKGVMASDLGTDLNRFVVRTDQNVHMVLLANDKGLLIYHSYNVSLSLLPIYIFNTSLTGFTMDDWTSIKGTKQSNCSSYPKNSSLICRYNSVYDKDLVITIHEIKKFNYLFMIFHDTNDYTDYQVKSTKEMLNKLQTDAIQFLQIAIGIFLAAMFIAICILILIFYPIQNIIDNCHYIMGIKNKQNVHKNILLTKFFIPFLNPQLQMLYLAYTNLVKRFLSLSQSKGTLCKTLEALQYPKKIKQKAHLSLNRYLKKCLNLIETNKMVYMAPFHLPSQLMGRFVEKLLMTFYQ